MSDQGAAFVAIASVALAAVVAFLVYLARSHENLKRVEPGKARLKYRDASILGISTGGGGAAAAITGVWLSSGSLSWFGLAVLDAGVMATAYAVLGYLDVRLPPVHSAEASKRRAGRLETLIGTFAVIAGLSAFLSWGLDFVALPALGLTALLVVAWLGIVLRARTQVQR